MNRTIWTVALLAAALAFPAQAASVRYVHTDALGSVVAKTDENRVVLERREYEPYGRQLVPENLQDGPGYTGHVQDAATQLTYMQQRYYDPAIGRFLSVDPVTAHTNPGANFNRFWYASNNPYKFTDPDGRWVRNINDHPGAGPFSCHGRFCEEYEEDGVGMVGVQMAQFGSSESPEQPDNSSDDQGDPFMELAETFAEMYEKGKFKTGIIGQISTAKSYADLSADQFNLTIKWGLKDIDWYRKVGGSHYPYMQGSLIQWNRVDWSQVDPGPGDKWSPEQVMGRFFRMIDHGIYPLEDAPAGEL